MIFVDSSIPMYLVGAAHPTKDAARRVLERSINLGERLVTSADIGQEFPHRYSHIGRLDAVQPAFDALLGVADEVIPVDERAVQTAKELLLGLGGQSARDALHVAVMKQRGVERVMSCDSGFDRVAWITRVA